MFHDIYLSSSFLNCFFCENPTHNSFKPQYTTSVTCSGHSEHAQWHDVQYPNIIGLFWIEYCRQISSVKETTLVW